jgi:hypothetical protein
MTALSNITLQSPSDTVTFYNVPQNYRDLVLVIRTTLSSVAIVNFRLNEDSGSNYSSVLMRGNGTNTASTAQTFSHGLVWYAGNPQDGMATLQLIDYSTTNKHKIVLAREDTNNNATGAHVSRWLNTAPVTSIKIFANGTTFNSGSTLNLYGRIA